MEPLPDVGAPWLWPVPLVEDVLPVEEDKVELLAPAPELPEGVLWVPPAPAPVWSTPVEA